MPIYTKMQLEYIRLANARWNIKTGATRSGKTYIDINYIIPFRIRERVNKKGISVILGVTKETIERNILEPMREIFGSSLVGEIDNRNRCKLFGDRVYCLGAEKVNQVSKIRGASFKYVYGDEMVEWNEEVFELLKSRLDKPYSVFDGTLNPSHPNHWVKKFIDNEKINKYVQEYCIDDNKYLDPKFVEDLKKEYEGTVRYQRYILGKWALAEGLIYPMFNRDFHIVPTEPRPYSEYIVSMDYGIQNPTAMLVFGRSNNVWYLVKEYYHSGRDTKQQKTDGEYYDELIKLTYGINVKQIIVDPSASSFIALINKHGQYRVIKAKNDVLKGIQETAGMLSSNNFKINDCCKNTIKELELYSWDKKSSEDKPLKEFDHAMDSLRYFTLHIKEPNGIAFPKYRRLY